MISDEKRREVAKNMREYDVAEFRESAIVPFLDCLGYGYVNWRGILDELADLIDRPTCNNTLPQNWGTFECSECGAQFEVNSVFITAGGTDASEPVIPRYCPNCGAMVTEEGRNVQEL